MSYCVQKYDMEKKAWKNLYISREEKTATKLLSDLMELRTTGRYRIIVIKCTHPAKDSIKEILSRH
ncbi:hypothetical protein ES705_17163 [subsurface metagenome]|jgi:hypothetical protein